MPSTPPWSSCDSRSCGAGLMVVEPGSEAELLAPLPLRALPGLGPAAERRLTGLGLRTVGDVAAMPVDVLQARLGSQGAALHLMARGIDDRPVALPGQAR